MADGWLEVHCCAQGVHIRHIYSRLALTLRGRDVPMILSHPLVAMQAIASAGDDRPVEIRSAVLRCQARNGNLPEDVRWPRSWLRTTIAISRRWWVLR